jgi:hypothetical protein
MALIPLMVVVNTTRHWVAFDLAQCVLDFPHTWSTLSLISLATVFDAANETMISAPFVIFHLSLYFLYNRN